ncbi:MAG: acyl carrier protein [Syntrophales bacterium]
MERKEIENKVIEAASIAYRRPASDISPSTLFVKDLLSKSVNAFRMTMILDDTFELKIPFERVIKNQTIADAIDMVEELLATK